MSDYNVAYWCNICSNTQFTHPEMSAEKFKCDITIIGMTCEFRRKVQNVCLKGSINDLLPIHSSNCENFEDVLNGVFGGCVFCNSINNSLETCTKCSQLEN